MAFRSPGPPGRFRRPFRSGLAGLVGGLVCAAALTAGPAAVQGADPYPWNAYIGANNQPAPWAGFVRGLGRGNTGLALSGKDALVPRAGEPEFTAFMAEMADLSRDRDLILQVGGLLSARDVERTRAFMAMIEADRGDLWRRTVYLQARRLAEVTDPERIYWQVGNEINSWHYTRSLRLWKGEGGLAQEPDQAFVIPDYVEYFLAPTVAALNAASRDAFGRDDAIPIVLGTLAGAYREKSRAWLDALLNYRVRGDFAPELAGRTVHQLIDIIAIHYLQTHADASWAATLDGMWKRWVGSGRIKGIWATEELGVHQAETGIGAATAVKATARCLNFHLARGLAPRQGRCGLWGWWLGEPGTRGDEAMALLADFLGAAPLAVNDAGGSLAATGSLEWHAFTTTAGSPRAVVAVYPPRIDAAGRVTGLTIAAPAAGGGVKAVAYHFDRRGRRAIALAVEHDAGLYRLRLPAALDLRRGAALLILIGADMPPSAASTRKG